MPIDFDATNKYILITYPTTSTTAQEIYNSTMSWVDNKENIQYDVPMTATGYASLGGGAYTDKIFVLQNGWKLNFWSGSYTADIGGTLITDDGTSCTVLPTGSNIEVTIKVSSYATIAETGVSGLTETESQRLLEIEDIRTLIGYITGSGFSENKYSLSTIGERVGKGVINF